MKIGWPAVWAEARRALGEAAWNPTIGQVIVTELLGE
jgi:hypothetical protein